MRMPERIRSIKVPQQGSLVACLLIEMVAVTGIAAWKVYDFWTHTFLLASVKSEIVWLLVMAAILGAFDVWGITLVVRLLSATRKVRQKEARDG